MNLNKFLKTWVVSVMLLTVSGVAVADSSVLVRINKLKASVVEAHADKLISGTERDSMLVEWKKLNKLYTSYNKDKKLSSVERKTLDSRIKKFDLNLFRKKYD